ncbi:leukocyte receptor cluster member 1 homolog [Trichogramma pretiosum]|uniref:leukocyte receptor cluster member 1 homolog n=1 Tax=Trichogramma pretiosum TaxID=7493 RepID=UPI0006C9819B|nr:leukocyte receptor cluster member 1 homolog [Trichogramma pretiosum]
MNILPKKRWHVRTKENIARVRKDEALAAEQAKVEQDRIKKAESEARLKLLRDASRIQSGFEDASIHSETKAEPIKNIPESSSKHINFFEELEQGNIDHKKANKDYEKDVKEEQEKYEKQIGLLTYLGQNCKDSETKRWYNELPQRLCDEDANIEFKPNKKALEDPLSDIMRYKRILSLKKGVKPEPSRKITEIPQQITVPIPKETKPLPQVLDNDVKRYMNIISIKPSDEIEKSISNKRKRKHSSSSEDSDYSDKKHKKHKKNKKHKHKKSKKHKKNKEEKEVKSSLNIEKLRAERLEREKAERLRAQALIAEKETEKESARPTFKQKYNSQYFPELARQNYERSHKGNH